MSRSMDRVVRAVLSAALLVALALGGAVPRLALAEDSSVGTDTGTITVTAVEGNEGMVYDVYKLFTCDVDPVTLSSSKYAAKNVSFATDNVGTTIKSVIKTYDKTQDTDNWTATDCASYIESMFPDTGDDVRIAANGFAMNLAKAVDDLDATATLNAGEGKTLDEGYYMIVAHPQPKGSSTLSESASVGTAPIFTMLGNGQTLEIAEKVDLPTIAKTIEDDRASSDKKSADAQVGEDVSFKLTGTVSDNIGSFTQYIYTFVDTLPAGMDLVCASEGSFAESDVAVQILTSGVTYDVDASSFEATYASRVLTVAFETNGVNDLLAAKGVPATAAEGTTAAAIPVNASTVVTVTYKAELNSNAVQGSEGNKNTAHLIYGNDPQEPGYSGTGTTVTTSVRVFTYGIQLVKVDKDEELDDDAATGTTLAGAKFTIQSNTEGDNKGRYVKTDGTFGVTTLPETSSADYDDYVFETDGEGKLYVRGFESGTYTIDEIEAPGGFSKIAASLQLELTVTEATSDNPTRVTATLSGGNADGKDTNDDGVNDKGTRAVYDSATGIVTITVTDARTFMQLPLTGLSGITLAYVAGGAILAASLVAIARRKLARRD